MPGGRPSKYGPKIAADICAEIAKGKSLREISRQEGMPEVSTIFAWIGKHPEFSNQYAQAKTSQAEHMADEILEIADDGSNDWMERNIGEQTIVVPDHEHISRSKLRVDARKWLMAKMLPKKYGEKLELAGDEKSPLTIKVVSFGGNNSSS